MVSRILWSFILVVLAALTIPFSVFGKGPGKLPAEYAKFSHGELPKLIAASKKSLEMRQKEIDRKQADKGDKAWQHYHHCNRLAQRMAQLEWEDKAPKKADMTELFDVYAKALALEAKFEKVCLADTELRGRYQYPFLSVRLTKLALKVARNNLSPLVLPYWQDMLKKQHGSAVAGVWLATVAGAIRSSKPNAENLGLVEKLESLTDKYRETVASSNPTMKFTADRLKSQLGATKTEWKLLHAKDEKHRWLELLKGYQKTPLAKMIELESGVALGSVCKLALTQKKHLNSRNALPIAGGLKSPSCTFVAYYLGCFLLEGEIAQAQKAEDQEVTTAAFASAEAFINSGQDFHRKEVAPVLKASKARWKEDLLGEVLKNTKKRIDALKIEMQKK